MLGLETFAGPALADAATERKVLACLIKSEVAWQRLPQSFDGEAFHHDLNRIMYASIDNLYAHGAVIDPVSLFDSLPKESQSQLEDLGGWKYIDALKQMPIDPSNVDREADKLLELRTKRRVKDAGEKISSLPESVESIPEIKDKVELIVSEIEGGEKAEVLPIGEGGFEYIQKKMANPAEVPGLPSGFSSLDRTTQGFQAGRLYVVGARKKIGKSVLLLNWAKHLAIDLGIPILWISTEHSQADEFSRLLSRTSEVYEQSINNGTFSQIPLHVERVAEAYEQIKSSPFYFCSMPFFTLEQIKRLARKYVRVHGVRAVFFDYIKPGVRRNLAVSEWQEVGELAYGLKALAAKEEVPIISAVQINREGAGAWKAGEELDSDYFASSDRIAQALSVALILRKPTKKEKDSEGWDDEGFRIIRVTDNRHGISSYHYSLNFEGGILKLEESRAL